jgi:large subunit ribosomal protein L5e
MAFVKIYKTNAYFKRFQTRFRRRREGKTDYYARKRLIMQDKNKYSTPKYRFVARITNARVICQVVYATIQGDRVLCEAQSSELKRFGLEAGLTNYSAAYCTGLLLARRLLTQTGLDKVYAGADKVSGDEYKLPEGERKAFKAVLDVGLVATTTGNRVFGCLKGACDGGLHVPHSNKRYPGYKRDGEKETYNAKVHRDRIFGAHVQSYMKLLKESPEEGAYLAQFSKWDANLKKAGVDTIDKLYTKVHTEIKKNPARPPRKEKSGVPHKFTDKKKTVIETPSGRKYKRDRKITLEERKKRVDKKIAKALK